MEQIKRHIDLQHCSLVPRVKELYYDSDIRCVKYVDVRDLLKSS